MRWSTALLQSALLIIQFIWPSLGYTVFSKNYIFGDFFNPYDPSLGWTFLTSPDGLYTASNIADIYNGFYALFFTNDYATWGPPPGPYGYYSIFQAYVKLSDGPIYVPKGSRLSLDILFAGLSGYSNEFGYLSQGYYSPSFANCAVWLVDVEHHVTTRFVTTYGYNYYNLFLVHEHLGYPGMGAPDNGTPADFQGYSSWLQLPFNSFLNGLRIEYDRVGEGTIRIFVDGDLVYQFCRPGAYPSPLAGAKTIAEFASQPLASHDPVDSEWLQVYLGCGHDADKLDPAIFGITREIGPEQLTTSNIYSIPSEFMRRYDGRLGFGAGAALFIGYINIEIDKIFCLTDNSIVN